MERWQRALNEAITQPEELAEHFPIDPGVLSSVVKQYPMRITPYYLGLIKEPGDPIWLQCVPDERELGEDLLLSDPLNEKGLSPVPGLIHRYPDRVVLLVSSCCATLCRFCMRKNRTAPEGVTHAGTLPGDSLNYIRKSPAIRDVILSGGDPLLLSDEVLEDLLSRLRAISHVEMIRINTRIPVTLPERITMRLCRILKRYHPVYVSVHFNHPSEITPESSEACARLADARSPAGQPDRAAEGGQ